MYCIVDGCWRRGWKRAASIYGKNKLDFLLFGSQIATFLVVAALEQYGSAPIILGLSRPGLLDRRRACKGLNAKLYDNRPLHYLHLL